MIPLIMDCAGAAIFWRTSIDGGWKPPWKRAKLMETSGNETLETPRQF